MAQTQARVSPLVVVPMLLVVFGIPFLPLLIAWRWDWWEAWVYAGLCVLGFAVSRLLAARRHPDLLAERASSFQQAGAKAWDKLLAPVVGLGSGLIPLAAGLEARWSTDSPLAWPIKAVALFVFLAGYVLGTYALMENRFFSGVVRIQTERGHRVVSSGPYRWLRHPGYAGAVLVYLATPGFLDSVWAWLPAVLLVVALFVRTALEDRTLQAELPGYHEYAQRVTYRILPGVW